MTTNLPKPHRTLRTRRMTHSHENQVMSSGKEKHMVCCILDKILELFRYLLDNFQATVRHKRYK